MGPSLQALALFSLGALSGGFIVFSTTKTQVALEAPKSLAPQVLPAAARVEKDLSPSTILQYGLPGPITDVGARLGFVSGYDRQRRNPAWVAEQITPESLAHRDGDRGRSSFHEDSDIPPKFRASLNDYFRSGYDRGHQVPAADCKFSQAAMDETFIMSNVCPQVGEGFNRDYWAHFEDFCRRLTQTYKSVRIVTGPLYLPRKHLDGKWRVSYEVIGNPPNVAVPTHFYKIIVADQGTFGEMPAVEAFVLPNAEINNDTKLTEFIAPVDAVERASGLEFLPRLPPNRRKELCKEIDCSIFVRHFDDRTRKALPAPKARL